MANKTRKYPELTSLKGKIRENKSSYRKLAEGIGMSANTLSDKINGYYVFNVEEVDKIASALLITPNEIPKYFFPQMIRNATLQVSKEEAC